MHKSCIIVDGYSTGSKLAPAFKNLGYLCLHVRSTEKIPSIYERSFKPQDYCVDLTLNESEDFFNNLKSYMPKFIVAGTETGVGVVDLIGQHLGLETHDPLRAKARRNKFEMLEELRKHRLRYIKSVKTDNFDEARQFVLSIQFPVVVKPLSSAGSDSVVICHNMDQFERTWHLIINSKTVFGETNDYLLIQEYIKGQQYIVNSLSIHGVHYITEMWQDDRIYISGSGVIYDKEILLNHKDSHYQMIREYVINCLNALGIKHGPAHSEIIVDDHGPVLIETAARMQGAINDEAVCYALGYSHVSLTIGCFTAPENTISILNNWQGKKRELICVSLISNQEGEMVSESGLSVIKKMKNVHSIANTPLPADRIKKTIDLFTSPGAVYLIADNLDELLNDYQNIRNIEKRDLFVTKNSKE